MGDRWRRRVSPSRDAPESCCHPRVSNEPSPWITATATPLSPPVGMRDQLGAEVQRRRAVARRALAAFARYGYEQAVTPAFEREDVLLRAMPDRGGADLVRFLDPDTAEVLALRSDMTPQVARIVATREGSPMPMRLSYEGSVLRRARGRSSQRRQLAQAGVECVGWRSPEADREVLRVTLEALRDNGIGDVVVELGHAAPLRRAMAMVPDAAQDVVADGLARKDPAAWRHPLRAAPDVARALATVCALVGDAERVSREAPASLADLLDAGEREELQGLGETARALLREGLASKVLADLGELRGRAYYTGPCFQVFVAGAPAAVAGGGRYDHLLARYGVDLPATGAALDLDALQALARHEAPEAQERVVVVGEASARRAVASEVRSTGGIAIELDPTDEVSLRRFAEHVRATRVHRCG